MSLHLFPWRAITERCWARAERWFLIAQLNEIILLYFEARKFELPALPLAQNDLTYKAERPLVLQREVVAAILGRQEIERW